MTMGWIFDIAYYVRFLVFGFRFSIFVFFTKQACVLCRDEERKRCGDTLVLIHLEGEYLCAWMV